MNATLTHTCPKCAGVGTMPFRHIHDGVCFLCNGAKAVSERTAARWLASEMGPAPRLQATANAPKAPAQPFKSVNLGDFGTVRISRMDDGTFTARNLLVTDSDGDADSYWLRFSVVGGRVKVESEHIQNGMIPHWRRAERALQAALKV